MGLSHSKFSNDKPLPYTFQDIISYNILLQVHQVVVQYGSSGNGSAAAQKITVGTPESWEHSKSEVKHQYRVWAVFSGGKCLLLHCHLAAH
jgi:hypothetical protein